MYARRQALAPIAMRVRVRKFGPLDDADIAFGDLTVFVGPQATGKSILLQLLKLHLDRRAIHAEMRRFGLEWGKGLGEFLDLYFGEGMAALWRSESSMIVGRTQQNIEGLARSRGGAADERLFYIPAQRVMSVRDGLTRPFSEYRTGDPYMLRAFSEKLHHLLQTDFASASGLFPQRNRMNETLRGPLAEHVFGGFELRTEVARMQRRVVLEGADGTVLPYLVWSAGQREFVPLLLGFYHLLPPAKTPRRDNLDWAVIEEPEMGLHPNAITAALTVIMELLARGYRVCASTHSPHVLDLMWALRFIQENDGNADDVLALLRLNGTAPAKRLAAAAFARSLAVYYFPRTGSVRNISRLDPGADDDAEREWGGLTSFSSTAGVVVSAVADRRG